MTGEFTPVLGRNFSCVVSYVTYFVESAKNDSSAVTRLRRSDFIAAMYAFDLVFANFGIAMAARMPMITTTMSSSMSVKPRRVRFCIGFRPGKGSAVCHNVTAFQTPDIKQCRCQTG